MWLLPFVIVFLCKLVVLPVRIHPGSTSIVPYISPYSLAFEYLLTTRHHSRPVIRFVDRFKCVSLLPFHLGLFILLKACKRQSRDITQLNKERLIRSNDSIVRICNVTVKKSRNLGIIYYYPCSLRTIMSV